MPLHAMPSRIPLSNKPSRPTAALLKFLFSSLIGVVLFMVPIHYNGEVIIPIALLASTLQAFLANYSAGLITGIICTTAVVTVVAKLAAPAVILHRPFLNSVFNVTVPWLLLRLLAALFVVFCYYQIGPTLIRSEAIAGTVLHQLLPVLLSVFILAGLLLPLLMSFGLLELMGAICTRVMRPLFGLPGRSAIDCIASWLGDGSVGILMTTKQYEAGYYTQREAATISTTFSTVSITFSLVVAAQVGLQHRFLPFFLTVCLAVFIAAIILPKLPPLCRKRHVFIDGTAYQGEAEAIPAGQPSWSWGMTKALAKADAMSLLSALQNGLKNAIEMVFSMLPAVMSIGTLALLIAEYTPLFHYLGLPFLPLLQLLQVPEAEQAATMVIVGFADMFIPSVLATTLTSDMTRFIVAALSLTQLVYLSEVGALLLSSKIPITVLELFTIFLLRTLVTLPIVAGVAHMLF